MGMVGIKPPHRPFLRNLSTPSTRHPLPSYTHPTQGLTKQLSLGNMESINCKSQGCTGTPNRSMGVSHGPGVPANI
eukprot:752592-Hanusia_phi.AAC.4